MPSLSALREFKASFDDIGGQKTDLAARDIPFDDLAFPVFEPEPLPKPEAEKPETYNAVPDMETPDISPVDLSGGIDTLDFSAFLGAQPDDLPNPPAETPDVPGSEELYYPEDLLPDFTETPETESDDIFDLSEFDNLDLSAETMPPEDMPLPEDAAPPETTEGFDLGELDDFGLSKDMPLPAETNDGFDLGELDDFGLSDETAPPEEMPPPADDSFDLGELDDFALSEDMPPPADDGFEMGIEETASPEEMTVPESGKNIDLDHIYDGLEIPDEPVMTIPNGDTPADSFENFDLGGGFGTGSDGAAFEGSDPFSFPGLDNILDDTPDMSDAGAAAGFGWSRKRGKSDDVLPPESIDEIKLNDIELGYLQETLNGYPLNLRIACEEIIAEQFVSPEQMQKLIQCLVRGAPARETASLASNILSRSIIIPKSFEKSSGEALESEQASLGYIFAHRFLPIIKIFIIVAVIAASVFYLAYKFVYTPLKADSIYSIGLERISAGEYQRANERFTEAFNIHPKKDWFYKYAEAFRDERQYIYAEQKYDELLRFYPRDKKGVLDYAVLETWYLRNYAKADDILRRQLLDFAPNDYEGLLAAGDNSLAWGEIDPSRYDDARYSYARLLEHYGWTPPVVERMMQYFIRTDNLKEVLPLKAWFEENPKKRPIGAESLAELGGYLLDKQLEEARGVPNEYIDQIEGVRDILLKAVRADVTLPESHYHLARYYHSLNNIHEERVTLETAIRAFDRAKTESVKRLIYRIDTHQRLADLLLIQKEFIPAEENLVKGINLYEDAITRRLITRSPKYGRLYAGLGDLEYFVKTGDMEAAIRYYLRAQQNGWAPPDMQYRMGSAYYQLEDWRNALEYLFAASSELPLNRRILFALGNAALKRGNYFAASGYYSRLLDILESQRNRLPVLLPNDRPEYLELAERLMMARNNAGVASEMLASQTGDRSHLNRALAYYSEAESAWDARTRDPRSMVRSGSTSLPYLNIRNALYPQMNYEPQIFIRIDRDALENSMWEDLVPLTGQDRW